MKKAFGMKNDAVSGLAFTAAELQPRFLKGVAANRTLLYRGRLHPSSGRNATETSAGGRRRLLR